MLLLVTRDLAAALGIYPKLVAVWIIFSLVCGASRPELLSPLDTALGDKFSTLAISPMRDYLSSHFLKKLKEF